MGLVAFAVSREAARPQRRGESREEERPPSDRGGNRVLSLRAVLNANASFASSARERDR